MQGSKKYILACLCVTIYATLVFSADKPANISTTLDIASFMNIAKSLAGDQSLPVPDANLSQEFCRNSLKKEVRYMKIIKLQEQVSQKVQSQLLDQIQDCSNFRQNVLKLIAKYKKVRAELKNLKASSSCSATRNHNTNSVNITG